MWDVGCGFYFSRAFPTARAGFEEVTGSGRKKKRGGKEGFHTVEEVTGSGREKRKKKRGEGEKKEERERGEGIRERKKRRGKEGFHTVGC